jgi:hypothetical protein
MKAKKLVISLACGHSLVLEKHQVAGSMQGTVAYCGKCNKERRIKEKNWIASTEN